jgi:hypothetical protein
VCLCHAGGGGVEFEAQIGGIGAGLGGGVLGFVVGPWYGVATQEKLGFKSNLLHNASSEKKLGFQRTLFLSAEIKPDKIWEKYI